jgi:hypothetical protein
MRRDNSKGGHRQIHREGGRGAQRRGERNDSIRRRNEGYELSRMGHRLSGEVDLKEKGSKVISPLEQLADPEREFHIQNPRTVLILNNDFYRIGDDGRGAASSSSYWLVLCAKANLQPTNKRMADLGFRRVDQADLDSGILRVPGAVATHYERISGSQTFPAYGGSLALRFGNDVKKDQGYAQFFSTNGGVPKAKGLTTERLAAERVARQIWEYLKAEEVKK